MKVPDVVNSLFGVLLHFRMEQVALLGDIEAMLHQVKVEPQHRACLQFMWSPGGDLSE